VTPWGQKSLAWFSVAAVAGMTILFRVGLWYRAHLTARATKKSAAKPTSPVSARRAAIAVGILLSLIFSKYFYMASLSSYYTLYLIDTFDVGVADAQFRLFIFLGAVAAGTFLGGPIGDRIGFKAVIWGCRSR
jgi:FSR family fosmidomycin resistance protein-like MFS transporter